MQHTNAQNIQLRFNAILHVYTVAKRLEKRELTEVLSSLPMVAAILDYVWSAHFTAGIYVGTV